MDYSGGRDQAVADAYQSAMGKLLAGYRPGAPLVILLPGSLGSHLRRSPEPFAGVPISFDDFTTVWLNIGLLFDADGLKLALTPDAADLDGYIIVPDGPVEFALIPAYDGTKAFFEDNGYNYAVFGYDWRRSIREAADNLQSFLGGVQTAVQHAFGEDPLPRTTLLTHSQGGLVAKLFLHLPDTLGAAIKSTITIGAPFYGTAGQTQQYFQGQDMLNLIYGAARVAPILGSMPGPYTMMPMDYRTWERRGAALGLPRYPVLDPAGHAADLYDVSNIGKYPAWMSAKWLDDARQIRLDLDLDLPDALAPKVFHLRAMTTPTMALFRWADLPPGFVAGQTAPSFTLDTGAPGGGMADGDGTVAGFAAAPAGNLSRLLTLPTRQRHGDLAENVRTLTAAQAIMDTGALPDLNTLEGLPDTAYQATDRPAAATGDVHSFLNDIAAGRATASDPRLSRPDIARALHRELFK